MKKALIIRLFSVYLRQDSNPFRASRLYIDVSTFVLIYCVDERTRKTHSFLQNTSSYADVFRTHPPLLGYKTKSATAYAVKKLIAQKVVSKDKNSTLIPNNLYGEVSVLGTVQAGFPSAAEEELLDTMSLDEYLIKNKEATFMLKVKGDSMIDAGIMEGDMVLVERGKAPKPGQIVIAQVDGEYTMKYFRKRGETVYLEAANKKYKPIYPENDMTIEAVVQAVIRKY